MSMKLSPLKKQQGYLFCLKEDELLILGQWEVIQSVHLLKLKDSFMQIQNK